MDFILQASAILLALLIALLAIPLSMSYSIISNQQLQGYARFRWLFGLVRFQARFPGETKPGKPEKTSSSERSKPDKTRTNTRSGIALFKQSVFRRHIMTFIKKILRATHPKDLFLRLRIGLGDPADTGMLWSVLGPLAGMLKNLRSTRIEIEPEFMDSVLEIESHGHFRFIPLQFVALIIAFILSPTSIRAWRAIQQDNQ